MSGERITLLDSTVPSVTNVSGSLIAGGSASREKTRSPSPPPIAVAACTLHDADPDGHQVAGKAPNTNGGLCGTCAGVERDDDVPGHAMPGHGECQHVARHHTPSGAHQLQVLVTDAAGNRRPPRGTITVAGSPSGGSTGSTASSATDVAIGPGSPAVLRGPANGANASDQATLTAHWARTPKGSFTSRYGVRERITGRLTTSAGQPISGALLDVYATPGYQGARASLSDAGVHTGPNGEWSLTLPPDASSCVLRFAYRSHLNDTVSAATASLTLRVHAGLTLDIAPHTASVGRQIFFSGVLHGTPIPPGGKQLVLEASSGREWVEFRTISTTAKGRYRASYRFKFPGPVTYRFRVVSPYEADFPFLDGASNVVAVHEH